VIIAVIDNGKGFSPPQRMGDMAKDGKQGLAGMEERAHLVGGTLVIQSHPGYGSMVTLELQVQEKGQYRFLVPAAVVTGLTGYL